MSSVSISCLPPKPPPTRSRKRALCRAADRTGPTSAIARQKRRLRTGADIQAAVVVEPADGAMRLQMRVLHPLDGIDAFVDEVGLGEAGFDVADVAMQFGDDIALGVGDARGRRFVVQQRRARPHRLLGVEHGGQDFVDHLDQPASRLRRRFAGRDHRRDALPDAAHDGIEHQRVVGIVGVEFVPRGRKAARRRVAMRQHRDHARAPRAPRWRRYARCARKDAASAGFSCAAARRSPRPSCSGRCR